MSLLEHLADFSVRALVLAAMAALFLMRRRSAAMQHAVWTAVAIGMLGLFVLGPALPKLPVVVVRAAVPGRLPVPPAERTPYYTNGIAFVRPAPVATHPRPQSIDWSEAAADLYAGVAGVLLLRFVIGLLLAWKLVRSSTRIGKFFECPSITVPVSVGWLFPRILLPADWREWDQAKLEAVLAHETAHVRRWDGLIAVLAGINRCAFWFHPLAWWIERRLRLLAELACDEACVAQLGDRRRYANLLLEMAEAVDGSHGRLRGPVFSMAASSHLRKRVESILNGTPSKGLKWTTWVAIGLVGAPLVVAAGTFVPDGPTPLPPLLMFQRPPYVPYAAPPPPPPPAPRPDGALKFEVASIRPPAASGLPLPVGTTPGALPPPPPPPGQPGCLPRSSMDKGRLDRLCASVNELLTDAFGVSPSRLSAPDWTEDERFDISAKLPARATPDDIPVMLQSLLEDRFGMKFHREFREGTVHRLIVAKGGPKLKPAQQDSQPEWVTAAAAAKGPFGNGRIGGIRFRSIVVPGPDGAPITIWESPNLGFVRRSGTGGLSGTIHYEAPGISAGGLADLATLAGNGLDVPVLDQSGLSGRYQASLDVSMADLIAEVRASPGDVTAVHRAELNVLQTGLKKLGLEIETRKMPVEMIVIDHLEKTPTEN